MQHHSRKLLIIDDDTIVRQNIVAYLEDSGFQVFQASDGPTGLAAFREHQPDLVLTDLRMPVIDGLQVLRAIHDEEPDAPVIVISGAGVISDAGWRGTIKEEDQPLGHLFVSILQRLGVETNTFAGCTGTLNRV